MTPFFDIHCHSTFKHSLLKVGTFTNLSEPVTLKFKSLISAVQGIIKWVFGDPLDSQGSITQLLEGQANLVSLTIYAIENAHAKSMVINQIKNLTTNFDAQKVDRVRNKTVSYWQITQEELNKLRAIDNQPFANGKKIKIINNFNQYIENETNTLFVVVNFEGGHCFFSNRSVANPRIEEDILNNLVAIKNDPLLRPFYITLTHHSYNFLANHAFAVPNQWASDGTNIEGTKDLGGFNPKGGILTPTRLEFITEAGRRFIETALDNTNGKRILIDVKHLSLGARREYYELLRPADVPILASHIGVTGISWSDIETPSGEPLIRRIENFAGDANIKMIKYNDVISYTTPENHVVTFNPWSINLYDDDILEIIASEGLMGIALDIRILGMGNGREHEKERMAANELNFLFGEQVNNNLNDDDLSHAGGALSSVEHLNYLCSNILHIVKIGGDAAWNHICLGSDFDGLIVSVEYRNNRRTKANHLPTLRTNLTQKLPQVAALMNVDLSGVDVELMMNKFFFQNARDFLQRNFR